MVTVAMSNYFLNIVQMAPFSIASLFILFKYDIKIIKLGEIPSDFETMWKLMDSYVCLQAGWTDLLSNERSLRNSIKGFYPSLKGTFFPIYNLIGNSHGKI